MPSYRCRNIRVSVQCAATVVTPRGGLKIRRADSYAHARTAMPVAFQSARCEMSRNGCDESRFCGAKIKPRELGNAVMAAPRLSHITPHRAVPREYPRRVGLGRPRQCPLAGFPADIHRDGYIAKAAPRLECGR